MIEALRNDYRRHVDELGGQSSEGFGVLRDFIRCDIDTGTENEFGTSTAQLDWVD